MKNKARFVLMLLAAAVMLSGCQLAKEDVSAEEPRLIGVLLTEQYLDLTDSDAILEELMRQVAAGNNDPVIGLDGSRPLNAVITDDWEVSFPGVAGWPAYAASYVDQHGKTCNVTGGDEAVQLTNIAYASSDEEESVSFFVTCTLVAENRRDDFDPSAAPSIIYVNPMYQSKDGRIWAISGHGMAFSGDADGVSSSMELKQSVTETIDGKAKTVSSAIKVTIITRYAPVGTVITEMTAENQPLCSMSFQPGALQEYAPGPDCAYLIVEHQSRGNDRIISEREIVGKDDLTLQCWEMNADGHVQYPRAVELSWPND